MISFDDLEPGESRDIDHDGSARLHRLEEDRWRVLRPDAAGAWATIANIARTDYAEAPWHVSPPFPGLVDDEDWGGWGQALRSALSLPIPEYPED
jgi:hypothetical protein